MENRTWPSEIQVPKSPDVLKVDGTLDWAKAPQGGICYR